MNISWIKLISFERIYSFLLPSDFALKGREFTGVEFDWRFVKCVGWFYKTNYTESGYYNGNAEGLIDQTTEAAENAWEASIENWGHILQTGKPSPTAKGLATSHADLSLDEFHFIKDQYVTSDRTRNNPATHSNGNIADPRIELVRSMQGDPDYKNCLAVAQATLARKKFFPQRWDVRALGDTRIQLGKAFVVTGERVPYNESNQQTMNLVCSSVNHVIDANGYYMTIQGIRKFVLESGDTDQP